MRLYEDEPEVKQHFPHKHEIISLLAVGGHWVTTEDNLQVTNQTTWHDSCWPKHDRATPRFVNNIYIAPSSLQLDPPDSRILFLKATSVSFLNEEVWQASRARQGRYLRILMKDLQLLCSLTPLFDLYWPSCSIHHYRNTNQIVGLKNVSLVIPITFYSYKYIF